MAESHFQFPSQQSRSYDGLSTQGSSFQHFDEDERAIPASSKPTNQKIFLNGRVIVSHSSNLQQMFRNHADFFEACRDNTICQSAENCEQKQDSEVVLKKNVPEKKKMFQSQQHLCSLQVSDSKQDDPQHRIGKQGHHKQSSSNVFAFKNDNFKSKSNIQSNSKSQKSEEDHKKAIQEENNKQNKKLTSTHPLSNQSDKNKIPGKKSISRS